MGRAKGDNNASRRLVVILLLGSGYIGSAFASELTKRGRDWMNVHHTDIGIIPLLKGRISLVINTAAYIPKPSVAMCDNNQAETILGNVLLPATVANYCSQLQIPMAHVCTGCIWSDGQEHSEDDPPQRAFNGHCGFYVGTKLLGSDEVRKNTKHYIWRVRLPFDEFDSPRNYLSKLSKFTEVWDHDNSLSHRGDFVKACLDLWEMRAPWGTYSVMNPGSMTAAGIVRKLHEAGILGDYPSIVPGAQGGSLVSVKKLLATGVKMRSVEEAIDDSIKNWKPCINT